MLKRLVYSTLLLSATQGYAQAPQDALITITTYAEDGNTLPTLSDYIDTGIVGIGTHNLEAINAKVASLHASDVDSVSKLQALVDEHTEMITAFLTIVTNHIVMQNVDLVLDENSVQISDGTYAYGTTPMVTIPTLKVNASDGGVAVTYTLNGEVKAPGATANAQAGENTLVVTVTELGGDKETKIIRHTFTETEEAPLDVPTDFSGLGTFDGPFGTKGLQGTITDADGVASMRIDYSDGTYSLYSDGNINNASTRLAGTTYTITVTDDNGVVKTYDGTL